jgi:DNA-binding NtrC family response regulator
MPLPLQAKLLRVLENREVVRVGENDPIKVDVRVLAATHRDLKKLVRKKQFRQDLFYRLECMTIHLPPLRERPGDVELLVRRFLARLFGSDSSAPVLDPAAVERLRTCDWPGNVRQLQKVICRAAGVCRRGQILAEDIDLPADPGFGARQRAATPAAAAASGEEAALAGLRGFIEWAWQSNQAELWPLLQQQAECELLRHALAQPGVSQVQLARRLGMARNTLRARIEQHGLQSPAADP